MKIKPRFLKGCVLLLALLSGCKNGPVSSPSVSLFEQAMLSDSSGFYFVPVERFSAPDPLLPIGIFDSGTGGLTVMDELVRFDSYNNASLLPGGDGIPDFNRERFIYLADQANMPYGNYFATGKTDLLVEHILKDAQFLLSDKYYAAANDTQYRTDKQPVKAIVIACNTATAYGKDSIESFFRRAGIDVPVFGVIDAGAKGSLEVFSGLEDGSIGVFATVGTIASGGYENTLRKMIAEKGHTGQLEIYNRGGHGVAEAVDQEPDFIDPAAVSPRAEYRGPAPRHTEYPIELARLEVYNFDRSGNRLLTAGSDFTDIQLNSAGNYVRYHLVELLEDMRQQQARPLKALILGCTHYPYLTDTIGQVLNELYNYRADGKYVYREVLNPQVQLINPAENLALELYDYLHRRNLFNPEGDILRSEFYISVPDRNNSGVVVDESGRFTYDYKYGRNAGEIQQYVKVVPFSTSNIPSEVSERLSQQIPATYELIKTFHRSSDKVAGFPEDEKFK